VEIFDYVDVKTFHRRLDTRLPRYIDIIKKEAERYDFDWRFIAAVVYQESHYNPRARSYTGVKGLMQVTLRTAREMGIENRLDPAQSIHAGVKYMRKMYERFDDIDRRRDRLLIALASYNVGYGHVRDAQTIARRKGLDPEKWSSLKKTLPLLRYKKYYTTVRYGYARGTEPVRYVERILTYYDILRKKGTLEMARN
jgi:membrane-bound lytic murein transglycosylase F